jgi:hypothetical protein
LELFNEEKAELIPLKVNLGILRFKKMKARIESSKEFIEKRQ